MVSLALYNISGKEKGSVEAKDTIFNREPKKSVLHTAVEWFLASARQGTHSSKTRTEVRGGGRKPWKQKGTGRARAGSIRSPLWRGGGVIFGPKPRDYSFSMPLKLRKVAVAMAISEKVKTGKVKVIEGIEIKDGKTKNAVAMLKTLDIKKALIASDGSDKKTVQAFANIQNIKFVPSKDLNVFDILNHEWLVLDKTAVTNLEGRLSLK